jgi:hypothetical protein
VPRHVARFVTRLVAPLVVDYFASRRLIVDYFAFAACPGASARRAVRHAARRRLLPLRRVSGCLGTSCGSSRSSSSTTSTTTRVRVPRHVARLVTRNVVGLVVDYFAYAARLGALAHRAAHRLSSTTSPTPRNQVPRHVARLVVRFVAPLVVDYFAFARVWVSRHVARLVTRLVVDYSGRRDFLLRPHWLYFSHAVRRDYLSRGNTGSTSSMPRAAATSSSGCITSTIHLD